MSDEAINLARQKRVPFRVNRGEAIDFTISVKNVDGSGYDFTDHTVELLVYNSFSKTDSPEFEVTVTLATGSMRFTRASLTNKRQDFIYRLWVTDAAGKRKVWLNGPFEVLNREWDQNNSDDTLTISPAGDDVTLRITLLGFNPEDVTEDQAYTLWTNYFQYFAVGQVPPLP